MIIKLASASPLPPPNLQILSGKSNSNWRGFQGLALQLVPYLLQEWGLQVPALLGFRICSFKTSFHADICWHCRPSREKKKSNLVRNPQAKKPSRHSVQKIPLNVSNTTGFQFCFNFTFELNKIPNTGKVVLYPFQCSWICVWPKKP